MRCHACKALHARQEPYAKDDPDPRSLRFGVKRTWKDEEAGHD